MWTLEMRFNGGVETLTEEGVVVFFDTEEEALQKSDDRYVYAQKWDARMLNDYLSNLK